MNENILETKDLHYIYADGAVALKGISIGIKKGKCTAVLGANGAGKSTMFLNFNGIYRPSSGQVLFNGKPIDYSRKGLKELRRKIGMVFQDPDNQLFSASVFQDISFGVVNMKLPEKECRRRVDNAMEQIGITHLRDKPTHSLSFGQKKRVAIAGVLAMEPEVLVLDEPTAGLDPIGVSELMKMLRQIQTTLGITVVISTHDIDIVPLYCDYVFVMYHGMMVLEGTPKQVFTQKETIRDINLRLPRIGHLMEILKYKDDFDLDDSINTISEARIALKDWKARYLKR
ncbi:ATP-binding cassette domain-containing protein [Lutispora thermophila]|uniref:ABC transporter ATP-binding protein n=1 Tax=Lutispora thermophila DSM 19022 TaxID=1122184 RepID=A0A1M6D3K8_9FIRM|nr:ATP-binding cassette domain-containing protein [Lutispora thermophila]SHI67664.1 cobalt/nickel transport system ATP-binding protein [Lutispora thermophila DSM 19022]